LISFLRKREKILITHSLVNQFQCVMLKLWLNNPNVLQFMKNLYWLMSSLILESTLLIWLEIQASVLKFGNTRLINKMKLEGYTLIWGHINFWYLNIRWLVKNIIVDFSLICSKVIHGLNIQRKILHFVSLAIYFQVSHLESQDQTHLLLKDSIVGRKLMMGNDVLF